MVIYRTEWVLSWLSQSYLVLRLLMFSDQTRIRRPILCLLQFLCKSIRWHYHESSMLSSLLYPNRTWWAMLPLMLPDTPENFTFLLLYLLQIRCVGRNTLRSQTLYASEDRTTLKPKARAFSNFPHDNLVCFICFSFMHLNRFHPHSVAFPVDLTSSILNSLSAFHRWKKIEVTTPAC